MQDKMVNINTFHACDFLHSHAFVTSLGVANQHFSIKYLEYAFHHEFCLWNGWQCFNFTAFPHRFDFCAYSSRMNKIAAKCASSFIHAGGSDMLRVKIKYNVQNHSITDCIICLKCISESQIPIRKQWISAIKHGQRDSGMMHQWCKLFLNGTSVVQIIPQRQICANYSAVWSIEHFTDKLGKNKSRQNGKLAAQLPLEQNIPF